MGAVLLENVSLHWIKGGGEFKQFVKNRVEAIDSKIPAANWRHIPDFSLINQRLQLAQRFGDIAYQIAAGWIMARKIASAPPNTPAGRKKPYQSRLGAILKPYTTRSPNGRLRFTNREISRFYVEVAKQLGVGVFPAEYQQ